MQVRTMAEVEIYLQTIINSCLENEVAKTVKDEVALAVDEIVYKSGEPHSYVRRGIGLRNGGLGDQEVMNSNLIANGVLQVSDDALPKVIGGYNGGLDSDKSLAENIVKGYGSKDKWYNEERDFISFAVQEMEDTKSPVQALINGLIERGITVVDGSYK